MKNFCLLWLLVFNTTIGVKSQSNKDQAILHISYGSNLSPETLGLSRFQNVHWRVLAGTNDLLGEGTNFDSFSSFFWEKSGDYQLELHLNEDNLHESCSHGSEKLLWQVVVSPVRVTFQIENISFSDHCISENLEKGMKIQVPVIIDVEDKNAHITLSQLNLLFSGVECHLIATPVSLNLPLESGVNTITYHLKGSTQKKSYIMFDFYDHNGQITTYYHPEQL